MKRIIDPDGWINGKTIKIVNYRSSANASVIFFEDGTAVSVEPEYIKSVPDAKVTNPNLPKKEVT